MGSIIYEVSHIAHGILLLYLLGPEYYGLIGSLFAIVYVTISIVDFGFESSFAPFLPIILQNKNNFRRVIPLYLLVQICLLAIGASIVCSFYRTLFYDARQPFPFLFFLLLIILEGVRIFFRRFLHNIFLNKTTPKIFR